MSLITVMTTYATTTGGRNGRTSLEGGKMVLGMSVPREITGAAATEGMNAEQLFAMGYSSCYGQALIARAKNFGVDATNSSVTCEVMLNKGNTGFSLGVNLKISIPGQPTDKIKELAEEAHQICPYSKAIRGNVPVKLTVI